MKMQKLAAAWRLIRSGHYVLLVQRGPGFEPDIIAGGPGDIKDMILMSKGIKEAYNHLMTAIEYVATEKGELHALKELRDAVETIVEEKTDGGN